MTPFVHHGSVLRKIWGKGDTILFIFAGAAAEFALNKAVDWLYFTGKLPKDPIGRLFSTVQYARDIIYADEASAHDTIDRISSIHAAVEKGRKARIPDWAYRDVLYMLIHYSISAYEVLEQRLTDAEKEDVYEVFLRMGTRMQIPALPENYRAWLPDRDRHMMEDLERSDYTDDLFVQYKKHLGGLRYKLLLEAQKMVVPQQVAVKLGFKMPTSIRPLLSLYKLSRKAGMEWIAKSVLLPTRYLKQIRELDSISR